MPPDIAGLAEWARQNPSAREVDWHLQFHLPLVDTETWYGHASRQYASPQFDDLLWELPHALQDLLGAVNSRPSPFVYVVGVVVGPASALSGRAVSDAAASDQPRAPSIAGRRCQAAFAARDLRRPAALGQGGRTLVAIRSALKDDYLASGRLQLAFQSRSIEDLPEPLRKLMASLATPIDGQTRQTPVALAGWPLSPADYLEFLAGADIGLLMYSQLGYHVRSSGVLIEMLGAGIPVVVPAGSWHADQVSEPIFAHQEGLRERLPVVANLAAAELDWKVAVRSAVEQGITVGVDSPGASVPAAVAQTAVPAHASHLLVLLERDAPNPWNRYCSVSVEQRDASGTPRERSRDIIGYRGPGRWTTVLVPLSSQSRRIEIRLQTAFGHEPLVLQRMECCFLAASDQSRPAHGAVGRLFSDPGQAADCLRDIVDHYDHYDKTVRVWGRTVFAAHGRTGAARLDHPGGIVGGRPPRGGLTRRASRVSASEERRPCESL